MAEEQKPQAPIQRTAREITTGVDAKAPTLSLQPRNFAELWDFAKMIADTDFVPLALRGKPGSVIAAIQYGNDVGLPPMTSLRWIAVINGVPSLWGDGYWMLIRSHPLCQSAKELPPDEALAKGYGECTIHRRGDSEPTVRRYTIAMAEKAGLWGGKGSTPEKKQYSPWFTNPGRMLQMRARALCGRDTIPEATGPLYMREEVEDFEAIETTATEVKEEPLKIPQAVKDETNEQTQPNPVETPVSSGDGSLSSESAESQPQGTGTPPAPSGAGQSGEKPTEKVKAEGTKEKTPISSREWIANITDWLENRATTDEILATENYASQNMRGLTGAQQLEVCKIWNNRRKQIVKEREAAKASESS